MNLSFLLGAINNKYDNYVIIARHDKAYEELKERLINTHSHLKNHVDLRRFSGPKELIQHVRELKNSQIDQNIADLKSATTSSINVKFTHENLFRHCPSESWEQSSCLYRFAELIDHLDNKHSEVRYTYCSTCEKMIEEDDWSADRSQQYDKHCRKEHLDNNAGFSLDIWPSSQDFSNFELL